MSRDADLADLARHEIVAMHAFFVVWFAADGPDPDFAACADAFAVDFVMITPDGGLHGRADVVGRLRRARLSRPPGFAIRIEDVRVLWQAPASILVAYVEQQERGADRCSRRAAALFTPDPAAPRGVLWRFVQETWMQAPPNNG